MPEQLMPEQLMPEQPMPEQPMREQPMPEQPMPEQTMGMPRRAVPVAVVFAVVSTVTAALCWVRVSGVGPHHLVFFYLLPTAIVATFCGSVPAMLCALIATFAAAFFLYDPLYSIYVESVLDVGELIWFVGLALIGAKCASDLLQPLLLLPQQNPAARGRAPHGEITPRTEVRRLGAACAGTTRLNQNCAAS
jgi:K+-sensing histidine kinase KdpD